MSTHPLFAPVEPLSSASLYAATDPIAIADLDEDWAVPCQRIGKPRCDGQNPAAWIAYLTPCCPGKPLARFWCDPCKQAVLRSKAVQCHTCGAVLPTPRLEPLNRRTT